MGFPAQLDDNDSHYPHPRSYQTLHHANEYFALAVVGVLIIAFFLAMGLMFVHPTGSLMVFFGGLAFAGMAAIAEGFFHHAEKVATHRENHGGH